MAVPVIHIEKKEIRIIEENPNHIKVFGTLQEPVKVISEGPQGPPGPQGEPGMDGAGIRSDLIPASALSGHRFVTLDESGRLIPADCRNPDHVQMLIGMTLSAGDESGPLPVQTAGAVTDPALTVSSGPLYLGYDGAWTQTVPAEGAVQQIGHGEAPNTIMIRILTPILREG